MSGTGPAENRTTHPDGAEPITPPGPARPAAHVRAPQARRPVAFWAGAALGWLVIAYAVRGALVHRIDTRPAELARFVVGGALVHDLLIVPVALAAGALINRAVRGRWRAPVQAGAIIIATLSLFAYPELRGFGRRLGNPTSLPHRYGPNLAVVAGLVIVALAIGTGWRVMRRPRTPR